MRWRSVFGCEFQLPHHHDDDGEGYGDDSFFIHEIGFGRSVGYLSALKRRGRDRIEAVPTPGVAPANAFDSKPAPAKDPVRFHGLEKVMRAGRLVTAPRSGARNERK